jgi:hypothetical protein
LIDLGERERGEIVLCHFQVGNSGGSPLILDRFQTSCSCAGVERRVDGRYVIPESVTLEPGQQLELSVRVSVGAPQGERQRVGVVFQSNDPVRPTHAIEVLVPRVKGGVYAQPKAVILGSVPLGEPAKRILELYDTGRPGRKIATVRSTYPDRFDVRLIPLGKDEPPRRHASAGNLIARLEVTAHTERSGPLDGDVEIVLANEERPPDHIPVVGDVVPSVICRPERLVLHGRRAQGAGYSGEIHVASRHGKPGQVAI